MKVAAQALHLAPRAPTEQIIESSRRRFRIEPPPELDDWVPDHPPPDAAHWAAVGSAVASVVSTPPPDSEWEREQVRTSKLATAYRCPIPTAAEAYELIALLPPPPDVGPDWVAVYLHPAHHTLHESWALGSAATQIKRVAPLPPEAAAVWHIGAESLCPVSVVPFLDVVPDLAESSGYSADGAWHDWHEADGFASLPHDPDAYGLALALHASTKIGGLPTHNAAHTPTPSCPESGAPMTYAYALAADFFDVTFGDAGTLHVWMSGTQAMARMDSA